MRDYEKEPLQVLSLGGGVQSTAMLLMIRDGKLPMPDIAIHSDTGSEMPYTEEVIHYCADLCSEIGLRFEIVRSHRGRLHEDYMRLETVPVVGVRSCTMNFKVFPQRRLIREIVGKKNGVLLAESWLGITTDERRRRVKSDMKWIGNKFPLLDIVPTSRRECLELLKNEGLDIKKSGCFCCPYSGAKGFIKLRREFPELFKICIEMEEIYHQRWGKGKSLTPGISTLKSLEMPSLFSFGPEVIQIEESQCDSSGGCFL
jgi:hypothetical protein